MAGIEELLVGITSKFDDAGFKALDKATAKSNKTVSVLSKNMRNMFVGIIGTIGVKEILNASIKLQSLKKAFEAITGTKTGAEEQLKFIREESDRLGLSLEKTVGSYKKFFAAGKSQGLDNKDIQRIYSGAMEYATAKQLNEGETEQLLTAMTNLLVKNQVSARGLTGQLGKAMPEALQIAQRAMGKTDAEFKKLIKDGLTSSALLTAMGEQLHLEYGELAAKNADTIQGALNRIHNAWRGLLGSILDDEGMSEVTKLFNEIANILNSRELKQSVKIISHLLTLVLKNIRLIGGIAAIMGIKRLIAQLAILRVSFLTNTFAAGSLGAALQMDAGLASLKALTKASWGLVAPWLRVLGILSLVLVTIDLLTGKFTMLNDIINNTPTLKEAWNSKNGQELQRQISIKANAAKTSIAGDNRILQNALGTNTPTLDGRGTFNKYNKDGTIRADYKAAHPNEFKQQTTNNTTNNNAFTFNIQATEPKQVASEVQRQMLNVFDVFGKGRGFQGATR